jgi:hypothetical protein
MSTRFREVVNTRFGGRLSAGYHEPGSGKASAHEAAAAARGLPWSDSPWAAGLPDLQPLNDGPWSSDEARTAALVPVVEALWDWLHWPSSRQRAWSHEVVLRTVREVVSRCAWAHGAPEAADACAGAATIDDARAAAGWLVSDLAYLARTGPLHEMARSAHLAASIQHEAAAAAAAYAARAWAELGKPDAADEALRTACRIWREAALSQ